MPAGKIYKKGGATMDNINEMPDSPIELTDATIDEAIKKYPFVIVDCWAPWCGPCRMLGPIIESLAKKHAGDMVFGKLDVDSNPLTASKYGIRTIPDLMVFKNGEKSGDIVGAMPEAMLIKEINKYK
jgi:thioredoxin 1